MSLRTRVLVAFVIFSSIFPPKSGLAETPARGAFTATPQELLRSATSVKVDPDTVATILLNEETFTFDKEGRLVDTLHSIYRVDSEEGVKNWAESSTHWEPWHQSKPEIRARVITPDGSEHLLDVKTLADVPVHENTPETYSDTRAFGGPLPAVAVGAIVEEEIIVRDTAPFFAAGLVQRIYLKKNVPVVATRIVLSHPESLALRYFVQQTPEARITKSKENGVETIAIENGYIPARKTKLTNVPPDVVPGPQIDFATGASWQQMAQEYARQTNGKLQTSEVQPFLAKLNLTANSSLSRNQVIARAVAALHKTVRYTGIEFGEASLVPALPAETLKRKYGDCKDKSSLLVTMLRALGINANLALLDSGPGQDINPELVGMGMFDHAIVYVPASGKDAALWIDATAQYTRVGDLPYMDYGRWALIVDEKTTALTRTPDLVPERNLHREFREFKLAEFGNASIAENNEDTGAPEADYRDYYTGDNKELHENAEKYVKRAYLAEKLISLQHSEVADLEKPFSVTYTTKGKRGNTGFENAVTAIRIEDVFDRLPDYFTEENAEKPEQDKEPAEKEEPRTVDWQMFPFITEWNYRVVAPPGYKLRALPPATETKLASAKLTQHFSSNEEGTVVEGILRFESGKPRLTVAEALALRDAILKAKKSDPIYITFDQVGHSLITAGRFREGLQEYERLIQLHPKEALHRVYLARTLLELGLGERARAVSREATAVEPTSSQAFYELGWILQHDLIGRLRKKGFDYEGAIAAYKKAKELDPKDNEVRSGLAILLEFNADGDRYAPNSRLKEAAAELRELKTRDKDYAASFDDNLLYDLWYLSDFAGLAAELEKLPASDVRRGFLVAIAAVERGADAGIQKSVEITSDTGERGKALSNASAVLTRLHRYSLAADILAAAAKGQSNEGQLSAYAALLKKAVPRKDFKIDDAAPESVVQKLFSATLTTPFQYDRLVTLISRNGARETETKESREKLNKEMTVARITLERSGLPLDVLGDLTLPGIRFSREGDDAIGYKITVVPLGAEPQQLFVVKENGSYKILDQVSGTSKIPEHLGWQALDELERNNLAGARRWLDWAREQVQMSGGDDPLQGPIFPHFWTRGREGNADEIRKAALVLVQSKELQPRDIQLLIQLRDAEPVKEQKDRLDLAIAYAYHSQQMWTPLVPVAERLAKAYPDSVVAFRFASAAYAGLRRMDDWQKLVQDHLSRHPEEVQYTVAASRLANYQGDFVRGQQLLKDLMDRGKATQSEKNQFAWDALFIPNGVDRIAVEAAESANQLTRNANFGVMHTLACLYARDGKPRQARELILKAMDVAGLEQPDSATWLALALISESYGDNDAARTMYARVEKEKSEYPGSNYELAQQRLALMQKTAAARTAAAR